MNILWIEDFGGGLPPSTDTLESMFKNLLSFVDDWDEDELNLIKRPTDLNKFCEQQKSVHSIHLCRNYFDYIAFKAAHSITHGIDTIITDIRLDNPTAQFNSPIPEAYLSDKSKFHENGGFYIFNDLIHLGVPAERICFMTGEKNSFKGFEEKCTEIYMPKVTAFEKSDADYEKLRDWLTAQQSSYAILRRGIIDGCNQLATLTTDSELQEYFSGLKRYLPLREPKPAEKDSEYLHLARAIVHDWDEKGHNIPNCKDDPIRCSLGWLLRTARNWLAHDTLLKGG